MRAQRAHVVGDEILRALDDPAEIANAELLCLGQSAGQGEPGRIGEGSRAAGRKLGQRLTSRRSRRIRLRGLEIETKQIAMIVSHANILTCVAAFMTVAHRPGFLTPRGIGWRRRATPTQPDRT